MTEFKSILGKKIEETREEEENQKRLKEKHGIKENVKVVEKANMGKFLINKTIALTKLLSAIVLLILAIVGTLALVYKEPRNEMFVIINETWEQISNSVKYIFK